MSPIAFIKNPVRFLQIVSKYRATTAGAPNFGYELVLRKVKDTELTGLDLSCWKNAFNGSEPVRAATIV